MELHNDFCKISKIEDIVGIEMNCDPGGQDYPHHDNLGYCIKNIDLQGSRTTESESLGMTPPNILILSTASASRSVTISYITLLYHFECENAILGDGTEGEFGIREGRRKSTCQGTCGKWTDCLFLYFPSN